MELYEDGKPNSITKKITTIITDNIWILLILLITYGSLSSMGGITRPPKYLHNRCMGFERIHFRDQLIKTTDSDGIWNAGDELYENTFGLRIQNGAGENITIIAMNVDYQPYSDSWFPRKYHSKWNTRGFNCDINNIEGVRDSGCYKSTMEEVEIKDLWMEDLGNGNVEIRSGDRYDIKLKIVFTNSTNETFTETASCWGRVQ